LQVITERRLRWWLVGLTALFLVEILAIRQLTVSSPVPVERWQIGLLLAVPLACFIIFALLLRAAWWRNGEGRLAQARKALFWFFVFALIFIWVMVYSRMVFGWH
jgi:hypothetical protein